MKPEWASGAAPDCERGSGASDRYDGRIEASHTAPYAHHHRTMLDQALAYAALDMEVFPITARRAPLVDGPDVATTDEATIRTWWGRWPFADVAWALPEEILVLDLTEEDGRHGLRDFREREGVRASDVDTPIATTPTAGLHLYFATGGERSRTRPTSRGRGSTFARSADTSSCPEPTTAASG